MNDRHLSNRAQWLKALPTAFFLALLCLLAFPARAATLYLSPTGRDTAAGTSPDQALATLPAAWDKARAVTPGEAVTIVVLPGTYRAQTLIIDARVQRGPIVITSDRTAGERPAFVGDGTGTWLHYRGTLGRDSGLTVRALRIARYATAISLDGNRTDPAAFNRGTVLTDLAIEDIGSGSGGAGGDSAAPSTAAIRLVNAQDTTIRAIAFRRIRTADPARCAGLHAIYLASHARGARIIGNTFTDFCGSAIKLRDDSGDAVIDGNRFAAGSAPPAIEEWFCDMARTTACTKPQGECPSTGIRIGANAFGDMPVRRRVMVRGTRIQRPWCPPGSAAAPRFLFADGHTLP